MTTAGIMGEGFTVVLSWHKVIFLTTDFKLQHYVKIWTTGFLYSGHFPYPQKSTVILSVIDLHSLP